MARHNHRILVESRFKSCSYGNISPSSRYGVESRIGGNVFPLAE